MDWDALYCAVDDFCNAFEVVWRSRMITDGEQKRKRSSQLSLSEMLTIVIGFHASGYRTFKWHYLSLLEGHRKDFPNLISYHRFVEHIPSLTGPMAAYLMSQFGEITGIALVDSTALAVCGNKRISRNRVFEGHAKLSRTTIGWFFGFKVHLIINDRGELLGIRVTPGNVDDRSPVREMCRNRIGKLFGDKGYISTQLTADLLQQGVRLVTGLRKHMKEKLLPLWDKLLLRKRSLIETVIDQLKNISQIQHTRHRSPANYLVNVLAGLVADTHQPQKPSLNLTPEEIQQFEAMADAQLLVA